ncbi:MAG: DUF3892 domain-containing protein [Synergistaceae bacterium]|nr:DUF3892 domain-containing protein [Synergistaceae bacterium]
MKEITVSCYALKNYNEKQSGTLVERLKAFCARMNPRLEKMETKLRLREIVFDEISEDALMSAGMITFKTEDGQEISAEQLLEMELDFEIKDGGEIPVRIYRDKNGNKYDTIPDNLLTAALFRTAFGIFAPLNCEGDCEKCTAECRP